MAWVFLDDAFVQITQSDDPDYMRVDACLRGDIGRAFGTVDVQENTSQDGGFRFAARISRNLVALRMMDVFQCIDYANFKECVTDFHRRHAYLDIERIMRSEQNLAMRRECCDLNGLLPPELVEKIRKPLPPEIVPPPLAPESKAAMKRRKGKA